MSKAEELKKSHVVYLLTRACYVFLKGNFRLTRRLINQALEIINDLDKTDSPT